MKYLVQIAVPNSRAHELEHLAGVATAELALAARQSIGAASLECFELAEQPGGEGDSFGQLTFPECDAVLTGDQVKAFREQVEGGKGRSDKRCKVNVLRTADVLREPSRRERTNS